jgi:HEAT repeat protein
LSTTRAWEIPKHPAGPAVHLTRVLALIGGSEALSALTGQLASPQAEVRSAAATALAGLGALDAAKPLTALLKDGDWEVRRDAAAAVTALGIRSAVPDLVDLLADWHLLVRGQALESLKQLTGQDLGYEKAPWKAWVEAHPDFVKDAP